MIKDVDKFLVGITIGIRYRHNFSIQDCIGKIADTVLYAEGSFFNENMFPRILSVPDLVLDNEDTGDNLQINNTNLILQCNIKHPRLQVNDRINPTLEIKELPEINKRFSQDIINKVMKEFKFRNINRIGYIRRYLFDVDGLPNGFISQTVGKGLGEVRDIDVRFSRKYPTPEAMVKKDVHDYHNVIFHVIKKPDLNEIYFSVDYQAYYDPFIESLSEADFSSFMNSMEEYNNKTFSKWVNQYHGESYDKERETHRQVS